MSRRVPLLEFCDTMSSVTKRTGYHTVLTPDHIRTMMYRAKKAGKPTPYPFVMREDGRHPLLADIDLHDAWAVKNGRPVYPVGTEGSAR